MKPKATIQSTPLSLPNKSPRSIYTVTNILTPEECSSIIGSHPDLVPSHVTPGTVRDRVVFHDEDFAEIVWGRLQQFFEPEGDRQDGKMDSMIVDEDGALWRAQGLNETWRLCRYIAGGKFSAHMDGRRLASVNSQSFMTLNIYLTTIPTHHCGSTRFLSSSPFTSPPMSTDSLVLFQTQPVLGAAAIFRDDVWHDGDRLLEGVKYLLRTDVMYQRVTPFDFNGLYARLGDEERARKALGLAEGLEDAGNQEEAVRWYKKAFGIWPALERGG